ncbi:MAG: M12 family metallo-peptidase [Bacteroidota bacterium]|nr:M12 family metallo-peptidase [Bacteroidota bacterium]
MKLQYSTKLKHFHLLFITLLFTTMSYSINAQVKTEALWSDINEATIVEKNDRQIIPLFYRTVDLNINQLEAVLNQAPREFTEGAKTEKVVISLPMPDGTFSRFYIVNSPIMELELAVKYPEIQTYAGQGIDDPTATVRFDLTPAGFHAMILSANGTVFIDPYSRGNIDNYISYYKKDFIVDESRRKEFICNFETDFDMAKEISDLIATGLTKYSGTQLRTYRLAVAATGEYTAYHGGTVAKGLAAVVTSTNRVNGVYEKEVAVRMVLVANNEIIIYSNSATDPYTNSSGTTMLGQNQTNLDAVIGNANYDIGHVYSTGGGGVAGLGVVCRTSNKARGVTGSPAPIGDPFDIDYVAHEIGHQFGGNHTFNGDAGNCSGTNRNASTAYEPGSGSTIMAYAGICSPQDLQMNSHDYFHLASIMEIVTYTTLGSGNGCPVITSTGNDPPVVNAGTRGFSIPINTPFTLTGSATDPNNHPLTYCWEEYDLGAAGAPNSPVGTAPIFRSFRGVTSPSRTFPKIADIINNTQVMGEILPSYARGLKFRLTARDNRSGGGGVGWDSISFSVTNTAGPFQVTSPNTTLSWAGSSLQTVTWNVANTNLSPVNCSNVKILLSGDGGYTYPFVLATDTPNDGSEIITIPNISTSQARIRVEAVGNIFFDISNANFSIVPSSITVTVPNGGEAWVIGTSQSITWTSTGVTNVKIEYTMNNGTDWLTITESVPASPASFLWTVPNTATTQARIRVSSATVSSLSDISNNVFSIQYPPSITLISPDGGELYPIGFQKNIQWSSINVSGNVKIELSRDGGLNYEDIFASTPNDGSENWIVSGMTTEEAKIKITSLSLPTIFDVSNSNFYIRTATITVTSPNGGESPRVGVPYPINWESQNMLGEVRVELSRNGGTSYETIIATTDNDGSEMWTPENPLSNSTRIRILAVGNPSIFDESDNNFYIYPQDFITITSPLLNDNCLIGTEYPITWESFGTSGFVKIELSKNSGSNYQTLSESTADDGIEHLTFSLPTTAHALIKISDAAYSDFSSTSEVFLIGVYDSIKYRAGWNILSLPSIAVPNSKSQIFPDAISNIFGYINNAYVTTETIQNGKGYWVKFAKDSTTLFIGAQRLFDTLTVSNGWNLIGGISVPIGISNITSDPPGMLSSLFYTYKQGYKSTDTVYPGDGVWVKANQDGRFIFNPNNSVQKNSALKFAKAIRNLSSIRFKDKLNNSQVLYFSNNIEQTDEYSLSALPPRPYENLFDVRFQSNRFVETKNLKSNNEFPILFQGIEFPLTVQWNIQDEIKPLFSVDGKDYPMVVKGELILTNSSISKMTLKLTEKEYSGLPSEFQLYQNYPNPFNPTTNIRYALPKASFVSLKIYNILGIEISALVNEFQEAGYYDVDFSIDQKNKLTSGVYYYQIKADNVLITKKAVVLK